jgi:5-formyltetrahydrofolate cyclo-ligase
MSKPTPSPASPKSEWRAWALEARRSLDLAALSAQLHTALLPALVDAQHVLLYAATMQEIDVLSLVPELPTTQFYLPRCAPKRRLAIHAYPCPLATSPFGISEPVASEPEIDPTTLDLVLVPALVLDQRGYRLGYGGGYYDRFLPRLRPDCRTLGIAPLLVAELPTDPWDVPVGLFSGGISGSGG